MSVIGDLRREWKTYLSQRLWILAALLLVLCGLALFQYHWIDQVAHAERDRAKTNLSLALSRLEKDFDLEITRAFVAFQAPFANPADYSERYKEWSRHAPYPDLIRGVYIAEVGDSKSLPKAVVSGEPAIRSTEWQRDLAKLPLAGIAVSASVFGSAVALQTFSPGGMEASFGPSNPAVMIDGNPAFVFPIMPIPPAVTTRGVARGAGATLFRGEGIGRVRKPAGPSQWALVVLDADYIRTTLLPRLVNFYFSNASGSNYEIFVLNKSDIGPRQIIFHSDPVLLETRLFDPDGRIDLFELRLDCFLPSSSVAIKAIRVGVNVHVLSGDSVSEILARRSPVCSGPGPSSLENLHGLWEMSVKYRTGSLDQTIAIFRHRNLLLGGSVLLVLALGISMLVVLTERARVLAEMQAEFVLGVSHELRTPLTVICVAGDNLKKGMVESSDHVRKYGEIIRTQALELSNMIEETLTLARMRPATPIGDRTPVTPEQIVMGALSDYAPTLRDAGIETDLDLAPDLPLINVDLRLMKGCIENLIQNVIKYAAEGRWMAIRARTVDKLEGRRVQISIEDRGPGISPADLPHIFEPFYRGKGAEASRVPGLGLGLTLVKRVVEAHHGTVEGQSSSIAGTRFSILLPCVQNQSQMQKVV